jgi:type IV secretory pathway VirB2 component (pilin)
MEMTHQVSSKATSKNVNTGAMKLALMLTVGALLLEPSIAMAAPWDQAVKAIADTLTGTLGRTIAIIAVVVLGFMAMAGKLEWMNAIKVIVGIVIVFSAAQIINWIAPASMVADTIAANSQAECNARNYVWVPAGVEVFDGKSILQYASAAQCVEPKFASGVCSSTVSNAGVLATNGTAAVGALMVPGGAGRFTVNIAAGTCS